jgi:hypothetical protein
MSQSGSPSPERIPADEAESVLAARAELGSVYDAELVAGFADRIEQVVEARVVQRSGTTLDRQAEAKLEKDAGDRQLVLGMVSLGAGIPISAIAAVQTEPGLVGLAVAWAGIVGVNLAHAWQSRRHRPQG